MNYSETSNIGILDPEGLYLNPLTGVEYTERYRELARIWSKFPAYEFREQIINDIRTHQVTLVISGTGSGKTVLLPKFALHALGYESKIAITLPKKIITKSAAEFAAETLDVQLGNQVGYQYRGSSVRSANTKLLYCTDGTLVSRLISDPTLSEFDVAIIDEAHERKVNIDFLLYLLKETLAKRPTFKLIIMSATINEEIFRTYFSAFSFKVVEIGGRTNYPIESIFIDAPLNVNKKEYLTEGVKIIKMLIEKITSERETSNQEDTATGILFFVTSVSETREICELIAKTDIVTNVCLSVYSGMDTEQEKLATSQEYFVQEFGQNTGQNGRLKIKLLVSTNVAESSLTVEGIKYVIDSGLELRSRFDSINRVSILEKKLISHAQAKQRMGRTGRTGPGTCYHLYTKEDFTDKMERFPAPAIRTESITTEILRLLSMDTIGTVDKLKEILNSFIEPPTEKSVDADISHLVRLGCIDSNNLTQLGKVTVNLQVQPEEARAILTGYRLHVFREVLAVITLSNTIRQSIPNLYVLPVDADANGELNIESSKKKNLDRLKNKFENAKKEFSNQYGDIVSLLKIFQTYEELSIKEKQARRNDKDKFDTSSDISSDISSELERPKTNDVGLNDWIYSKFLKRSVLESAYTYYSKNKHMIRRILVELEKSSDALVKIPPSIDELKEVNTIYRVLAAFEYGYGSVKIKSDGLKIGNLKIELDPQTFMTPPAKVKTKAKSMIYFSLFKFGDSAVKAKITTYASEKAHEILKKLE